MGQPGSKSVRVTLTNGAALSVSRVGLTELTTENLHIYGEGFQVKIWADKIETIDISREGGPKCPCGQCS